jgi:hypothetical protein
VPVGWRWFSEGEEDGKRGAGQQKCACNLAQYIASHKEYATSGRPLLHRRHSLDFRWLAIVFKRIT